MKVIICSVIHPNHTYIENSDNQIDVEQSYGHDSCIWIESGSNEEVESHKTRRECRQYIAHSILGYEQMLSTAYHNHHPSRVFTEVYGANDVGYQIALADEERYDILIVRMQ